MGLLGHQWAGVRADRAPLADWLDLVTRFGDGRAGRARGRTVRSPGWWIRPAVAAGTPHFRACLEGILAGVPVLGWAAAREPTSAPAPCVLISILGSLADDPDVLAGVESHIAPT
jgi:hypothetical protein